MKDQQDNRAEPGPAPGPPLTANGPPPGAVNGSGLRRNVLITNPQGLHMRPSAAFAELAGRFQSSVTVHYEGKAVNGKSLWDLMLLAAMPNTEVTLEVDGPDAVAALEALVALLQAPPEGEVPPAGPAPPAPAS
jgi:phosphotransferase system HPr (HPr) family protein